MRRADSQQEPCISQPSSAGFGFSVMKYAWRPVCIPKARVNRMDLSPDAFPQAYGTFPSLARPPELLTEADTHLER